MDSGQDFIQFDSLDLNNKRILLREDFNVPIRNGIVQNNARLNAALPTLKKLLQNNARTLIISHLGRPIEGQYTEEFSLKPVADVLSQLLHQKVRFEKNWLDGTSVQPKEIVLCENVRFNEGEKANDLKLSQQMAALCDIFIMDAFATAHRAEASTVGVAKYAPIAAGGPLLTAELNALDRVLKNPKKPIVAVIGGSKISSKLPILKSLLSKVDILIVGGGIANQFIAQDRFIGGSLYEPEYLTATKSLLESAKHLNVKVVIPIDGVVSKGIESTQKRVTDFSDILAEEKILDVGPNTSKLYAQILDSACTILWNGPLGVFESEPFSSGTEKLAASIAASKAFSVAGGGETLEVIDKYKISKNISYISTGGGAFLEYLEGKILPAVAILEARAKEREG